MGGRPLPFARRFSRRRPALAALAVVAAVGASDRCVKPVVVVEPPSNVNVLAHIEPPPMPLKSTPKSFRRTPSPSATALSSEPGPEETPAP